jgi:signal transduction histidine kinase
VRLVLWPQSLFGRLLAAMIVAVVIAEAGTLYLIASDREQLMLSGTVREWSRRITEITVLLEQLPPAQRAATVVQLRQQAARLATRPLGAGVARWARMRRVTGALLLPPIAARGPPTHLPGGPREARALRPPWPRIFIHLPLMSDGAEVLPRQLAQQLRADLGGELPVRVRPAVAPVATVIPIPPPFFAPPPGARARRFDVDVHLPDGTGLVFRVTLMPPRALLPHGLLVNFILLMTILVVALYVMARSITRPLSRLADAADSVGRSIRQPKLEEHGARELGRAARAFNTMQDRLQRYLDSRTRVLAAMSHDLKTPLTRLRLQVETQLESQALKERFGAELDEMERMVRGALALFRGLDDDEALEPVDIDALLESVRAGFVEMGEDVSVEGRALQPFVGKPQALKRCLTNLLANAVKFGARARILVRDGAALEIRVRDDGPGIPEEELERVFEPFYRLESSRSRDTGGTGLGLSIARDVAQAHGGSIVLRNLPEGGLEARLTLPRGR